MSLPACETLLLEQAGGVLHVTLNRPDARNAMSLAMVGELRSVLAAVRQGSDVRALVLRGADGHFCAGGDIRTWPRRAAADAYRELNRAFGSLLEEAQAAPQVVIAVLEGAVLGGGFGLACISDIAIAHQGAQFGLPETGLGILPAQIAPFVVKRIGLTQARRLALTAARFDGNGRCAWAWCTSPRPMTPPSTHASAPPWSRCAAVPRRQRTDQGTAAGHRGTRAGPVAGRRRRLVRRRRDRSRRRRRTMAFVQKRKPTWAQ